MGRKLDPERADPKRVGGWDEGVDYPDAPLPAPRRNDLRLVSDVLLGEILIQQGTATSEQIDEALKFQRNSGILVGAALIQLGFATPKQIETGLRFQKGMRAASASPGTTLPTATKDSDLELISDMLLGELLVRLGYITCGNLQKGLVAHQATGMRIGESLVSLGVVSWEQIEHAVSLQRADDGNSRKSVP